MPEYRVARESGRWAVQYRAEDGHWALVGYADSAAEAEAAATIAMLVMPPFYWKAA